MTRLLGFIIAFFVAGWGLRWYFSRTDEQEGYQELPTATPTVALGRNNAPTATLSGDEGNTLSAHGMSRLSTPDYLNVAEEAAEDSEETDDDSTDDSDSDDSELAEIPVTDVIIGFCARCRDKREVGNATYTRTKKGKLAIRGNCTVCDAGMFVFVPESSLDS